MNSNSPVDGPPVRPSANPSGSRGYPMAPPAHPSLSRPSPQSPALPTLPPAILSTVPSPPSPPPSLVVAASENETNLTTPPTNTPNSGQHHTTPPPSTLVRRNRQAANRPANAALLAGKRVFREIKTTPKRTYDPETQLQHVLRHANITTVAFNNFLDVPILHTLMGRSKIESISSSSHIYIYAPPQPYHDCSPPFLRRVLQRTSFDTAARQDTLQVCQSSWRAPDGSYLVPDAAVAVLDIESDEPPRLWPTIVVEVARSKTYHTAVEKVTRWFRASEGMVEVALLLMFTEEDPLVNPACFIDVFRCRPTSSPGAEAGPKVPDSVIAGLAGDGDGGDGCDQVRQIAAQDATGSKDKDTAPTRTSSSAAVAIQEDTTRSGSEHHNTADSSDNCNLSNAPYHPDRSPPTLEIYQHGPRHIVVPTASADSSYRHIELQYSDFFGRENVPAGRDPAEKVELELDLLRKELLVRLHLTQAQMGSLKRKGTAEDALGGGDKRVKKV